MEFDIQVGWGKAVPLPPHPIYIPPDMQEEENAKVVAITSLLYQSPLSVPALHHISILSLHRHSINPCITSLLYQYMYISTLSIPALHHYSIITSFLYHYITSLSIPALHHCSINPSITSLFYQSQHYITTQ